MYKFKTPTDVLRALDIIFSNLNIYPPRMLPIDKEKWVGDVSDGERVFFKFNQEGLVGISYDEVVFDKFEDFEKSVLDIHTKFMKRQGIRVETILPDRIVVLEEDG